MSDSGAIETTVVACPSCGGDVPLRIGAAMSVCPYCRALVARGDRDVENRGKVVDLIDTPTRVQLGTSVRFGDLHFAVVGRTQYRHEKGGFWDEWYLAQADGSWLWLAEAQGRLYVTMPTSAPELLAFEKVALGAPFGGTPPALALTVTERGVAMAHSAAGELPFAFQAGTSVRYVDAHGVDGAFASATYDDGGHALFVGREVTAEELELPPALAASPRRAAGVALACPTCAAPLALRAPEQTERVGCPACGQLLDVEHGALRALKLLQPPTVAPEIPLGATGALCGGSFTVIGYLERQVKNEWGTFPWREYLLYDPRIGFRWLVENEGHWSFVEPCSVGLVDLESSTQSYDGRTYKLFANDEAEITFVAGEFHWKVKPGERTRMVDYIAPPYMLSFEDDGDERHCSLSTYVPHRQIAAAFALDMLPAPQGVGANQPFAHRGIYRVYAILLTLAVLIGAAAYAAQPLRDVARQQWTLPPLASAEASTIVFSDPFDLEFGSNVEIELSAGVSNSWAYLEGDLVDDASGEVTSFESALEEWHGVENGESWREEYHTRRAIFSSPRTGRHLVRIEAQWQQWMEPLELVMSVRQGVVTGTLAMVLVLLTWPVFLFAFGHAAFSHRRWENSEFTDYDSGGG